MSLYVSWINLIKERADENWLTDSQREVYERILKSWMSQTFINLHGPPGSGKTFIARLLAKKHGYSYLHKLEQAPKNAKQVILDNSHYTRMLRPIARGLGLGRVVLITRNSLPEAMPNVILKLNEKDVSQFLSILSNSCGIVFTHTKPVGRDLTEIIRKEIIMRGETHVRQ